MIYVTTRLIILGVFLASTSPLLADLYVSGHSCHKPIKPYKFNSRYELDNFNANVKRFKECIVEFIDKQNDAVKTHNEAAEKAIKDWNDYARNGF